MSVLNKAFCISAVLLCASCADGGITSGREASDWRQNPQLNHAPPPYGDNLYRDVGYPTPEYRHWVHQQLREQRLRDRGRVDNSTDSGTGFGQRPDTSSW
ncbi:hypothetical protein BTJ39_16500 [Izhakiella australiensis]|uniref:Uncharacterized protein n=1 Tax=Izhakiella australiensis TaxID=1926881 RepID=A0A1S8YIS6_9GAMM|nr:hypothetical protein [Izhakiella australiensis]OON38954.1 hypothetical protein BTJ39_16500 [Izhakiella australiensis]